jgi:hypothetical protein
MPIEYAYGYDQAVASFVAKLIPHCRRGFGPNARAIGIVEGQELIAGLVYHNYDPDAAIIEISGAALPGRRWLSRETIRRMYRFPFLDCNCQMVVQRTPADNERLLGMLAAYDYSFISMPRLFGRDRHGVICCLTYEAWAGNRFNQRFNHHIQDLPNPLFREAAE